MEMRSKVAKEPHSKSIEHHYGRPGILDSILDALRTAPGVSAGP